MYLFFDTETNGKPLDYKAPENDLNNWPRMAQIAYSVYDKDRKHIVSFQTLVKPEGWDIPNEPFFIEHGMSTEKCTENGLELWSVLQLFAAVIRECDTMVAHNMKFDSSVVMCEMIRKKVKVGSPRKIDKICTMLSSVDYCKLPGSYAGKYKWPKLEELYFILFGKNFDGAHDAENDTKAMAECFFKLQDLGVIK